MVRREAHRKYVHFAGLEPLLFDLEADPHKTINRANDPAYARERLRMAEALLAWRGRHLERRYTDLVLAPAGPTGRAR